MRRRLLLAFIVSLVLYGLASLASAASALEAFRALSPEQQRPAPTFTLPDHQGVAIDSVALRGKVVVVRFWATW
jgi:cytochrome oxidase Cu insertion factor (SCO1/SenC/PrrC family)